MPRKSFGILGGGMMGIDLALKIKEAGYDVTILEAAPSIGGLTDSAKFGIYKWDKFYHVILPDDKYTIKMISNLGLKNEIIWEETKTGFYSNGGYYSLSNIVDFLKFPVVSLIDKFRLGLTILVGAYLKDYEKLEKIPVTEWLKKWSGERTFNKIWLPLLKSKLGEDYKKTSAAFICSTIKRLYGARKEGTKKELFGYVKGGYSVILKNLNAKIIKENIIVKTDAKVELIKENDDKTIRARTKTAEYEFDYFISTIPSFITASICPGLTKIELDKLKEINYLGVICTSVLLKKKLTDYYVINITDDNFVPFTGVIEMTALVNKDFFNGNSLVYLPKYVNSKDSILNADDDTIAVNFLANLRKMQPTIKREDILHTQVARAKHVIAIPEMDYSKKIPSWNTTIENFFIINSSFIYDGTLNVNETLKVADKYYTKVMDYIENQK